MEIKPVAIFHSPLKEKFGIPRQPGLASDLHGTIELESEFRSPEALRGLDGFDYIWLIWEFNLNRSSSSHLTVRPPRLGGNERVGVFASRSPFRPNSLGLSSVKVEKVDYEKCTIEVSGADLADGTPVYDIKPYVEYSDSHSGIRCGFVSGTQWTPLKVEIPEQLASAIPAGDLAAVTEVLSQDPRPRYHDDESRVYGITYGSSNIRFSVSGDTLTVVGVDSLSGRK